jgi:biopolymer transport protein ExbD
MKLLSYVGLETSESVEINLSPLIDMVFLLLIFFMVTTVFVEETGIEIEKPAAASSQRLEKESVLIAVTRAGEVVYAQREIGVNAVRGLVSRLLAQRQVPVIILADEHAATGTVVEVIDQCKLGGAAEVSIATRQK